MFKNKEYDKVFENCNKAINLGFPVFDCYILMATASYETNNYQLERDYATLAIERDPTSYEGYLIRARAYFYLSDYRNSIKDFYVAYEMTKDDNILYEIALVYKKMEKYSVALNILKDLYGRYPHNTSLISSLIDIYKEMKFYNNSIYLLDKLCVNKDYNKINCINKKIEILYEMGDYEYALIELNGIFNFDQNFNNSFYCKILTKNGFKCTKSQLI